MAIVEKKPRSAASPRRSVGGFTLIEVLCVVVIMAIAAAIVFAGLSNTNDVQAGSGARTVMTDLMYAQNRAIATQQPVYVTFNTTASSYSLCSSLIGPTYLTNPVTQANYSNTFGSGSLLTLSNCVFQTVNLGGQTSMYFDQLGTPYSCSSTGTGPAAFTTAGSVVIISGGTRYAITIQPDTGDMTIAMQ